jgi:hypothetical protein
MELNKKVAGAISGCDTISDVDEIFGMFKVTELSSKIDYLIAALGGEVFMLPGDNKEESKYDTILAAFLTEKQRITEKEKQKSKV